MMDLERALTAELSRLAFLAEVAARRLASRPPWWIGALAFLRKAVR